MTLKSDQTNPFKDEATSDQLNEIFIQNDLTKDNIVKIFPIGSTIIVVWDDEI